MRKLLAPLGELGAPAHGAAVRLALLLATVLWISLAPVRPAPAQRCPGDCNRNGAITIDELIILVNLALATSDTSCPDADRNRDSEITIDEILQAVNAALGGCGEMTPIATASLTPAQPTPTASPFPDTATPAAGSTPTSTPTDLAPCCACVEPSDAPPTIPAVFCGFFEGPAQRAAAEARCQVVAPVPGDAGLLCVNATAGNCGAALAEESIACP
jgi:hypothetical protein